MKESTVCFMGVCLFAVSGLMLSIIFHPLAWVMLFMEFYMVLFYVWFDKNEWLDGLNAGRKYDGRKGH